mgnify:CR=1 FL=1
MSDSYWISSEGRLFLVPGQHMRHAEMEEVIAQEAVSYTHLTLPTKA